MKKIINMLIFCSMVSLSATSTFAGLPTWIGAANSTNDWHTAGNWDTGLVPGAGDIPTINTDNGWAEISTADAESIRIVISRGGLLNNNRTLTFGNDYFNLGSSTLGTGTYKQTGASSILTNVSSLYMCDATGEEGIFIVDDGAAYITGAVQGGIKGIARCYQNGGTVNIGADLGLGNNTGGEGYYTLNGGILNIATYFYCGYKAAGTGYYSQYGGTNNVNNRVYIAGRNISSTGTVMVAGGELNLTYNYDVYIAALAGTKGTLILTNGVINCTKGILMGNNGGVGSYYQYGGTNNVPKSIIMAYSGSTVDVVFAGGTLNNIGGSLYTSYGGDSTVEIRGSNATIKTSALYCNNVGATGSTELKFILDGKGSAISPIECAGGANLSTVDDNITVAWDITSSFGGNAGDTYDLIVAGSAILTNGCTFSNLTGGDFSIALVNSDKTLQLTLNEALGVMRGTMIIIR